MLMKDYEAPYFDLLGRTQAVRAFHVRTRSSAGGLTGGYCAGCDWVWPCPTLHLLEGWDYDACIEAAWCSHEALPYR
jgi:hypothetical protein